MNREGLRRIIRAAAAMLREHTVVIIGSQSILASFSEFMLPTDATLSAEADILPFDDIQLPFDDIQLLVATGRWTDGMWGPWNTGDKAGATGKKRNWWPLLPSHQAAPFDVLLLQNTER